MQRIYDCTLSDVLGGFLGKKADVLSMIQCFEGSAWIENDVFFFSLPALFELSISQYSKKNTMNANYFKNRYKEYRSLIYRNSTNEKLKAMGGFVEVHNANNDHALSIYKLSGI